MPPYTESPDNSPSSIASQWVDGRLVGVQATVNKRLHKRMVLMSAGSALLSGIGAYSFSYVEPGLAHEILTGAAGAALPAIIASLTTIGVLYPVLRRRAQWQLEAMAATTHGNVDLLSVLGKLTELRSGETAGHNLRVTLCTLEFAEALHLPAEEIVHTVKGALLHDVGKLAIPDSILGKPGPLTPEERMEMNKHVHYGLEIILQSTMLRDAIPVVSCHHEHYDGGGYPRGLVGDDIPLGARMFALIDVFDALTSERVYKPAYSVEEAIDIMAENRGTHFDPALFDRFMEVIPDFARRLPRNEASLTKLLINRLQPYLGLFVPEQAPPDSSRLRPTWAASIFGKGRPWSCK